MFHHLRLWRYFKKIPLIGLDIGIDEIRLLQLCKTAEGFHIEKIAWEPVAIETEVQASLAFLVSRTQSMGHWAVIGMPSHRIIRKKISFPASMEEQEIAQEIQQRLSEYLPGIPKEELHFDFTIHRSTEDTHHILLAAVKKEHLRQYVHIVTQAGLIVNVVDADLYALARASLSCSPPLQENQSDAAVFLNVHWPTFTFITVYQNDVVFHHQWQIEKTITPSSSEYLALFLQQFKNTWRVCMHTHPHILIRFIGISGSFIHLNTFLAPLQEEFGIPAQCLQPFQHMTHASSINETALHTNSSRFLLCCGLAMRNPAIC